VLQRQPGLNPSGLKGGALYTDSRTDDARLTLAVLESASRHGAAVANYVEVDGFLKATNGQIVGARVRDALTGETFEIRARHVLAAAGPWADDVRRLDDDSVRPILRLTKGTHLTVRHARLPLRQAVVMRSRDRERRMMFAIPRGSFTYLGTTDTDFHGDPATANTERSDVAYILDAANGWFSGANLREDDVVSTWVGLRPLVRPTRADARPSNVSRDYQLFRSASGLVTVGGGKLTAFRAMADHIVSQLFPSSRGPAQRAVSMAVLPGADGPLPKAEDWQLMAARTAVTPEQLHEWCALYGSNVFDVEKLLPPGGGDPGLAWHRAMVRYGVEHEMAQRLEDVYRRRTDLMLFSSANGRQWVQALAEEMASDLGWSASRTAEEVASVTSAIDAMFAFRGVEARA
jgi:glycerol-3-phosphate dehydrogenase